MNASERLELDQLCVSVDAAHERYHSPVSLGLCDDHQAMREFAKVIGAFNEGNIIMYEAMHKGGAFCQGM